MASRAALGFRLHTGWAALVAVAGVPGKLEVLLRRRIELLPSDSIPRFVYHAAAELPRSQADELVQKAQIASREAARSAVGDVLEHLQSLGISVKAAGIHCGTRPVPKDLSIVLRSHPMIHTAEGALFGEAVITACEALRLAVVSVRERDVWLSAAKAWRLEEGQLRQQIDGLRKSVGAPWATDQKMAAALGLLALRAGG